MKTNRTALFITLGVLLSIGFLSFSQFISSSYATHPLPLLNLRQRNGDLSALCSGCRVNGTDLRFGADSDPGTCGDGPYFMDVEVQRVELPFTNVPTQSSTLGLKPDCIQVAYPEVVISTAGLGGGRYKWQARERLASSSPGGPGEWRSFAGGGTAFIVGDLDLGQVAASGAIDRTVCRQLDAPVINLSAGPLTGISGTLTTVTPGVTITQGVSAYPDLNSLATGANLTPFEFCVADTFVCGTPVVFTLTLNYAGGSASFTITLPSGVPINYASFDFQDGTLQGFTTQAVQGTQLWHLANNVCRANLAGHSAPYTLYYGKDDTCNYNTGARNAANALSPPISMPGVAGATYTLNFNYLLQVETLTAYDLPFVDVSTDGGATWTTVVMKSELTNDNLWHNKTKDISAAVGAATSIRLRFRFDTVDSIDNNTTGWQVDDILVIGPACGCPLITLSPVALGNTAVGVPYSQTLTPSAGTAPFMFSPVSGALPAGISLSPAGVLSGTPTQTGPFNFTVKVTDSLGCMGTQAYMGSITCPVITLTQQPTAQTVCELGTATFTATANGVLAPTVKWQVNTGAGFVDVPSATTTTLTLNAVALSLNGAQYRAVFANSCNTVNSDAVTLTVNQTTATTALAPQTICENGTATFSTTASGTGPFSFVWKKGATVISSGITSTANTSTLTLSNVQTSDAGSYSVEVTGACNTATTTASLSVNTAPVITTQPVNQIVGQNATATFTAAASGSPTPTVQWQVDSGAGFTNIPGATNTTLTVPNVTAAMNGHRYRAVFSNTCGSVTSDAALLTVNTIKVHIGDPLLCLNAGGLVGVTVTITNNNAAPVNANFTATLPTTLNGLPGTGLSSIMPGVVTVTAAAVTWAGVIPANTTVTITYKAQIVAGTPANQPICVDSVVTFNGGPAATVQECQVLNCPANGVVKVSDQKPGALLVFPYYISKVAEKKDTRLTISNLSDKPLIAHVFFIDGATCQQADQFLCLTPFASFTFKASEQDPEAVGWMLVVAVDANGRPTQQNGLIGNAFVNDGDYVDNYGAESFKANSPLLATFTTDTATLFLDNQSYDAVPNQLAAEIQSPLDAPNQRVITVGLQGDLTRSTVTGAAQIGPGLIINGNEKPTGSFVGWLNGNCQAQALITSTTPRVPNGMNGLIPKGQVGTMQWRIGAGVGLLLTPRTASWPGIRTLHKVGSTATTLTIPLLVPSC